MKETQYDKMAEEYAKSGQTLAKKYQITPTFIMLCETLGGKRVLDLGCGSGFFTRIIKKDLKAKEVVGLDISKKEIELAKKQEEENPLGILYLVGDVINFDFEKLGGFDVVTAVFLLNYSSTKEELRKMCKNICSALRDKGKFITMLENPEDPTISRKDWGVVVTQKKPFKERDKRKITFYLNDEFLCYFENYHWEKETIESALKNAGFKKINWIIPIVSEEGINKYGKEFWQEFYDKPNIMGLICEK